MRTSLLRLSTLFTKLSTPVAAFDRAPVSAIQNPELAVSTMAITENVTTLLFMLPGSLGNAVRSVPHQIEASEALRTCPLGWDCASICAHSMCRAQEDMLLNVRSVKSRVTAITCLAIRKRPKGNWAEDSKSMSFAKLSSNSASAS